MKTNSRSRRILALCIIFLSAIPLVQAQKHEGKGKGNKHSEHKYNNHGNYSGNQGNGGGPKYYKRAPWGRHRPVILSHNHGRVYYYGGNYYEYYPDHGYLIIEIPAGYYFDEVPVGFNRVWIDGRWCYRRGDMYLRPGIHGFISFPGPAGISIGAGF